MKRLFTIFATLAMLILSASCTGVKLEQQESTFEVFPRVKWPDGFKEDTTKFVKNAVFTRIIGEHHYLAPYWRWSTMATGKYLIVSYAFPKGEYATTALDKYASDNTFSLKNVTMDVPTYDISEVNKRLNRVGAVLPDMAPDMPCVVGASTLLVGGKAASRTGEYKLPERLDQYSNSRGVYNDTLKVVSSTLDLQVSIIPGSGVVINEVVACFTGTPASLNLLTYEVERAHSGKMWFNMTKRSGSTYAYSFGCLGAIPSINDTFKTGAGILHLFITATAEGTTRTFVLSHNMKKEMDANPVLESMDASNTYRLMKTSVTYKVNSPVTVNASNVLYGELENLFDWQSAGIVDGGDDIRPTY